MKDVLASIQREFSLAFPKVKTLTQWPKDQKKEFPYITLNLVDVDIVRYASGEEYEGSFGIDNGTPRERVFSLGEYRANLNIFYWSKTEDGLLDFLEKWNEYFNGPKDSDAPIEAEKELDFNCRPPCEKFKLFYDSYQFDRSLKTSRRIIFSCRLSVPYLVRKTIPLITKPELNAEISEQVNVNA